MGGKITRRRSMNTCNEVLTCIVNSANSVRITNSPGRISVSMLTLLGNLALSLGAPQGRTWLEVSLSNLSGTESYSSSASSS